MLTKRTYWNCRTAHKFKWKQNKCRNNHCRRNASVSLHLLYAKSRTQSPQSQINILITAWLSEFLTTVFLIDFYK